jgi:predicted Zn-dependent peptidase
MHHVKKYENGLTLVTTPLKSTESVTVLILVGAGSRYETREINGISHYLEHLFFKGAKRYKTSKEVSSAVDGLGGEMNAFTGKEYAGYYIKIAAKHLEKSIDILSDMLLHSRFDPAEIDKERGVILEEYNMYQDTPMYQVLWDFEELIFGDQPLGWSEVGTKAFIMKAAQSDFRAYKEMLYVPANTVISVAGHVDQKEVENLIPPYFDFRTAPKGKNFDSYQQPSDPRSVSLTNKKTEQAHMVLGVEGFDYHDDRKYALEVMSVILGGNMSSRMFQKIRDDRGLAYYVQTSSSDYHDTGVLYTRAGVSLKDIDEVVKVVKGEYELIRQEKVSSEELIKAKEYLKGKMVLHMEDSEAVAHFYGRQELLLGKIETPKEEMEKIDQVTMDDILQVSKDLFTRPYYLSVIGPFDDKEHFSALLSA